MMLEPDTSQPLDHSSKEQQAREYEAAHNRLFLIRIVITLIALSVYLFSGASAQLAEGLRSRYGSAWLIINGLYTVITVFGFAAFMFPLSFYGDYVLEHRYGLLHQHMDSWFFDYLKSLLIEIVLSLVFFEIIYAFLRFLPAHWWIWATLFYVLFAVVLTSIAPVVIMPLFHKFKPLEDTRLTEAVKAFVEQAGVKVVGVYQWGLEEKTSTANAALAGLGRTRRIILGDTMLKDYTQEEIIAVLAHEVGHYKHRDLSRLIISGAVLAAVGFYVIQLLLHTLVQRFGFSGIADIGSFPLLAFCLFVFSLIIMPISNIISRNREFAADAFAVRAIGSAEPLVTALSKLAEQNLSDKEPAPWIEFLLHGHPSISHRIARARKVEEGKA